MLNTAICILFVYIMILSYGFTDFVHFWVSEFVALNKFLLKVKNLIMKLQFLVQHFLSVL